MFGFIKVYYILKNRSREKKWSVMSKEQRIEYFATTKDKANKRLDSASLTRYTTGCGDNVNFRLHGVGVMPKLSRGIRSAW
jgi:hypothetical protein